MPLTFSLQEKRNRAARLWGPCAVLSVLGCSSASSDTPQPSADAAPDVSAPDAATDATIVQPADAAPAPDATDSAPPAVGDDASDDAGTAPDVGTDAAIDAAPEAGTFTFFGLPSGDGLFLADITVGPDENLWYTERGRDLDGGIWTSVLGTSTTDGLISERTVATNNVQPIGLVPGPDGAMWIVEQAAPLADGGPSMHFIQRVALDGGATQQYPLPAPGLIPLWITKGPDGSLWFSILNSGAALAATGFIGRITPAGVMTTYPLPTERVGHRITVGPDGNLWFAESGAPLADGGVATGAIGRITTAGVITEFPTPSGASALGIAVGPDGNLWFTEPAGRALADGGAVPGAVGKITTAGALTEYADPVPRSRPQLLTAGSDGNLWIADPGVSTLLQVTTAGVVTEAPPPGASDILGIVSGPDGNIWFAEYGGLERYAL